MGFVGIKARNDIDFSDGPFQSAKGAITDDTYLAPCWQCLFVHGCEPSFTALASFLVVSTRTLASTAFSLAVRTGRQTHGCLQTTSVSCLRSEEHTSELQSR